MRWYGVSLIIFLPAANVWCDASTTGRAWGRDPVHWAHSKCTWSRALDNWSMHLIQLERRKRKGGREREKGEGRERKGERWKIENTLFNQYCLIYSLSTLSLSFSFPPTLYFPPPSLSLIYTVLQLPTWLLSTTRRTCWHDDKHVGTWPGHSFSWE